MHISVFELIWNMIWSGAIGYGMFAWGRRYERNQQKQEPFSLERKEPTIDNPFTPPR